MYIEASGSAHRPSLVLLRAHSPQSLSDLLKRNSGRHVSICYSTEKTTNHCRVFRNYRSRYSDHNPTLIEAVRATWAFQGLFSTLRFGPPLMQERLHGVLGYDNPTRVAIRAACEDLGKETAVSSVLSLGSGKRAAITASSAALSTQVSRDPEVTADDLYTQFSGTGVYFRFTVDQELEPGSSRLEGHFGTIRSHTECYLQGGEVNDKLEGYIRTSEGPGTITLESLNHTKSSQRDGRGGGDPESATVQSNEYRLLERASVTYLALYLFTYFMASLSFLPFSRLLVGRGTNGNVSSIDEASKVPTRSSEFTGRAAVTESIGTSVDSGTNAPETRPVANRRSLKQHNLPPISPFFVSREEPMNQIVKALVGHQCKGQRLVVVSGMGGSGKTQLSIKFAQENENHFQFIIFIDASSPESIRKGFTAQMSRIHHCFRGMTLEEILDAFADPDGDIPADWLIILDNADNPDLNLGDFIPSCEHGAILITTRNPSLKNLAPRAHLPLKVMFPEEAVKALLFCVFGTEPPPPPSRESHEALMIVGVLGFLPVAVIQAGCYILEHKCFYEYRARLSESRHTIFNFTSPQRDIHKYPHGLYSAFDITLRVLSRRAHQLLSILSFFHYSGLPRRVITIAGEHNFAFESEDLLERPSLYQDSVSLLKGLLCPRVTWSEAEIDLLLNELQRHSLLTLMEIHSTITLRFHPLLHGWANDTIPSEERALLQAASVRLLACGADYAHVDIREYLSPHVNIALKVVEELHVNDLACFSLIIRDDNELEQHRRLWEGIHERVAEVHGTRHIRTTRAALELASAYGYMGDAERMEQMEREVVALRSEICGPEAEETITAAGYLAHTLNFYMSNHDEAGQLWSKILSTRRATLGPRHFGTTIALYHLGQTHILQGRYKEALPLLQEAVTMRDELDGRIKVDTLHAMELLACCYDKMGALEEADQLREEVLELRQKIYCRVHRDTLYAMGHLAISYVQQGRNQEAEEMLSNVLKGSTELYGSQDAKTLSTMTWLGEALYNQQRYAEAELLWKEALQGRRRLYGNHHANIQTSKHYLAHWYLPPALRWREVLEIREPRNANGLFLICKLAQAVGNQGRHAEAEDLRAQALEMKRELYGSDSPVTTDC